MTDEELPTFSIGKWKRKSDLLQSQLVVIEDINFEPNQFKKDPVPVLTYTDQEDEGNLLELSKTAYMDLVKLFGTKKSNMLGQSVMLKCKPGTFDVDGQKTEGFSISFESSE